jgi:hypothetical protein
MANPIAVLSFVWTYVVPVIKDGVELLTSGAYTFIKDQVDNQDVLALKGITKRNRVYADTMAFCDEKNIDTTMFSSVLIYLLIEIAVANLKKQQKKLIKKGGSA